MAVINVSAANSLGMANAIGRKGGLTGAGLAGDALLFDGVQIVTYIVQGTKTSVNGRLVESGIATYAIPHALKRQVSRREAAASGGRLELDDVIFEIPRLELATNPRPGDRIVAGGRTWSVLFSDDATLRTRWRVFVRLGA